MNSKDIRKKTLDLIVEYGEGHPGGAFSCIEILIALYDHILRKNDIFILSKGHACQALFVVLREKGYNPTISGHPDIEIEQGIPCTTGSLGHGLPIGVGIAIAKKLKKEPGHVYILISDGECQEGTTWESLMIASHHKLDNLTVIIDRNRIQALGKTENILDIEDLAEKFNAFRCYTQRINDGHKIECLLSGFKNKTNGQPRAIIVNTIKGKGVSYMENDPKWHARLPTEEELKIAHEELG